MRVWLMVFAAMIICCPVHAGGAQSSPACPAHAQHQKAPDPGAHGCCDRTAKITSIAHCPDIPAEALSWLKVLSSENDRVYDFTGVSHETNSSVVPLPSVLR